MTSSPSEYSVREQRGWYLYDWANSPYFTSVLAVFLGPYLTALAKAAADANGFIHPFGIPVDARSLYPYLISISVAGQVIFLPVVGAIADYGHRKKELLGLTAFLGAAATVAMFFIQGTNYMLGAALLIVSNISFGASIVVYNSFLPEIAPPEQRDAISSRGWALGYAGGGVLLALNLLLLFRADRLGISQAMAVRISLASAGVWCVLFTIPVLIALRNRGPARVPPPGQNRVAVAFRQLAHTLRDTRRYPQTLLFLVAYLIYNDAIQTVLAVAGQFGSDGLGMPISQVTTAYPDGPVRRNLRRDRVRPAGRTDRNQARHRHYAGDLGRDPDLHLRLRLHGYSILLCDGGSRDRDGRQPGVEPVSVRSTGAQRQGSRVLQHLRNQRQGHQLAGARILRSGAPVDRELSHRDPVADRFLRCGAGDSYPRERGKRRTGCGANESPARNTAH